MNLPWPRSANNRLRSVLRVALSHYLASGLTAALGLLLISGLGQLLLGPVAASAVSVGVIVCIPPDQAAPLRGKAWQLLPAALLGLPLFVAVQWLHAAPLSLGLLLVPATFVAFLAGAWGKQGLPITVSMMFALIFSIALPPQRAAGAALASALHFSTGAVAYLVWATLANRWLNARHRETLLADTLLSLSRLMRTQARQLAGGEPGGGRPAAPLVGLLLQQQAALSDQLQATRNLLLESPHTARRQQLAGMLIQVLEMRDQLLACELDLDKLQARPGHARGLDALRAIFESLAAAIETLADALLLRRLPPAFASRRAELAAIAWGDTAPAATAKDAALPPSALARGLASRVGHVNDEVLRLVALARGELAPDHAVVHAAWQMFVSPVAWSWQPLKTLWRWDAPALRHALRAALAMASAYGIALALPWGRHEYWILLTIVVVLRGSLAQTLERRNSRVGGTLLGCLLTATLLSVRPSAATLLLVLTLAQAVAHAFAARRYLVTAIAATVLGLVQSHLLGAGASPGFELAERIVDTLIGGTIAWIFSYVLPSWERGQIPQLVARALAAQARHARLALGSAPLQAVGHGPELAWRLARRETYDSLSALVQATQRALSEPRAVRPPLAQLARLLTRSYQLLAQLTAVKTLLLLRRERLNLGRVAGPLAQAASTVELALAGRPWAGAPGPATAPPEVALELPDPFDSDLTPWLLRRLDIAADTALQINAEAEQVLQLSATASP